MRHANTGRYDFGRVAARQTRLKRREVFYGRG